MATLIALHNRRFAVVQKDSEGRVISTSADSATQPTSTAADAAADAAAAVAAAAAATAAAVVVSTDSNAIDVATLPPVAAPTVSQPVHSAHAHGHAPHGLGHSHRLSGSGAAALNATAAAATTAGSVSTSSGSGSAPPSPAIGGRHGAAVTAAHQRSKSPTPYRRYSIDANAAELDTPVGTNVDLFACPLTVGGNPNAGGGGSGSGSGSGSAADPAARTLARASGSPLLAGARARLLQATSDDNIAATAQNTMTTSITLEDVTSAEDANGESFLLPMLPLPASSSASAAAAARATAANMSPSAGIRSYYATSAATPKFSSSSFSVPFVPASSPAPSPPLAPAVPAAVSLPGSASATPADVSAASTAAATAAAHGHHVKRGVGSPDLLPLPVAAVHITTPAVRGARSRPMTSSLTFAAPGSSDSAAAGSGDALPAMPSLSLAITEPDAASPNAATGSGADLGGNTDAAHAALADAGSNSSSSSANALAPATATSAAAGSTSAAASPMAALASPTTLAHFNSPGGSETLERSRRGMHRAILQLTRVLRRGRAVKEELDLVVDICGERCNLRDSIATAMAEESSLAGRESEERTLRAAKYLESYAILIIFNAYLRERSYAREAFATAHAEAVYLGLHPELVVAKSNSNIAVHIEGKTVVTLEKLHKLMAEVRCEAIPIISFDYHPKIVLFFFLLRNVCSFILS